MRALFLRLSVAVLLSLLTLVFTFWWYDQTLPKNTKNTTDKPIAFVGPIVNEVLKRPADRLLWQNAETNEPLFNGEAIRTPADANAKVLFEGSGRVLDIEPGSLIVIQKNEGQIALELMEGSIQVAKNQNAYQNSNLVLKSENGQIDLSQATASLSKNSKTGLSLEVLEGTASVNTRDGKKQLIKTGEAGQLNQSGVNFKQNQIKLLKPQKFVDINADTLDPVEFSWSGIPEKTNVGVWLGAKRNQLKEMLQTTDTSTKLELNVNTKYFWKVVVYDHQKQILGESLTSQFETRLDISKNASLENLTPQFPKNKSKVAIDKIPQNISFKWSSNGKDTKIKFVLSKNADLSNPLPTKQPGQEKFLDASVEPGIYFWQISSTKTLANGQVVSASAPSAIQQVEIIKSEALLEAEKNRVQISWNSVDNPIPVFYLKEPQLSLTWNYKSTTAAKVNVASWKVNLKNKKTMEEVTHQTTSAKLERASEANAEYTATIQAFDSAEKLIGTSEARDLRVLFKPLLNSPQILGDKGALQANPNGSLNIAWQKINGAKEYEFQLYESDGKLKNKKRYLSPQTSLQNLFPGEYKIRVLTIDEHNRPSEPLAFKSIMVPAKSGLRAPSAIKTKVQGQKGAE